MKTLLEFVCLTAGLVLAAGTPTLVAAEDLATAELRCEYQKNPVGLDVPQPRFSWQLAATGRDIRQTAYRIRVARTPGQLQGPDLLWDSGRRESDATTHVAYEGPALVSGGEYCWQVQVWDNRARVSAWSEVARWEMGLLRPEDWTARWIRPDLVEDHTRSNPVPMLRRTFTVGKRVLSARIYATAQGLYEFELNGRRVGSAELTPGWTAYDHRLQYQVYDVTPLLAEGPNAWGALLGDGWFRGHMVWEQRRNNYGTEVALLAQLVIRYADGTREVVATDEHWKCNTGPILLSDIYDGETYDARLERQGWSLPAYADGDWRGVRVVDAPAARLVASGPVVRRIEELKPVKVFQTPAGVTVLDLGQNMVGRMRFRLSAPAGTTVTLRHAEVLDRDGNFYTANLRAAAQQVRYTTRGEGVETFEPHFTFQGFRYVAVSGWPGEVKPEDFTGVVLHSEMEPTGQFECSNPLLNQLQHNIVWGQKGNFVDIPTDCPQRDERLGWTGDAQVFARTAMFNHNTAAFFTKWLRDLAADQQADGAVPHVIPDVLQHRTGKGDSGATGWSDAAVIVPWTVYQVYGDRRVLEAQYPSMKAWVEHMRREAGESYLWKSGAHFGDWLCYMTVDPGYPGATTDKDFLQNAYFARSTDLLQRTAEVLGKKDEAADYAHLLANIKAAFRKEYVTASGRLSPNTQTAYALALAFDLLPASQRAPAAERLAADVRKFGHLTTGFLGTPVLCPVLSATGHLDVAYQLLNRKEYPSWLYSVTKGATTIWERWDGQKPDGTFQDVGMNSFNHYAYGAIGEWLYRVVAGLESDARQPGYKHIIVQPHPGGGLTYAKARYRSLHGPIESGWRIENGVAVVDVEIPANTSATVHLPHAKLAGVTESGRPVAEAEGVAQPSQVEDTVVMKIGSGRYSFRFPYEAGADL